MILHGTEVSQYFVIASVQRSGSYLLCECLENTGLCGIPTEAIAPENMPILVHEWGLSPDTTLAAFIPEVVRHCVGQNGVFGIKMHWNQIEWARQQLGIGERFDTKTIDYLFPNAKYIQIIRKDIRGQAISSYRAYATYEWWKKRDVFNYQVRNPDPPFNGKKIRWWENHFFDRYRDWDNYFAARGIEPLRVEYADLDQEWRPQTRRCLNYLGLDERAVDTASEPSLMRQADAVSRAWRRRLDEEDAAAGIKTRTL